MRVVLREAAHARQTVQRAGKLRTIDRAEFRVTQRQIAIRTLRRLVNADVKRAVHRLDAKLLPFKLHRREHRIGVVAFVTAREPQLAFRDVGRKHETVTASQELLAQVVFHLLANRAALRVPEDQSLAVLFLNREQVELAAETTMIALLCFFALLQPRIELFLREESRAVDALHLRLRRVAFPVSAGERKQFERAQFVRARHVWAETKVDERRALDVIDAHDVAGFLVDQFTLQRLVALVEDAQRFRFRDLVATIDQVLAGDLLHLFVDDGQIRFRQRLRRDHVVEETVTRIVEQCWTDAEFGARKEIEYGCGEQVRGRMTQHFETVARRGHDRFDLHGSVIARERIEWRGEVYLTALHFG